jgi:AcrR family transcriptional regulator
VRERILDATFACIARWGLAKTTVEDAAREARVSRATVYRYFPGGRDELVADAIRWEVDKFFLRLADEADDAEDFATVVERALLHAHQAIGEHAVLQRVLATEADRLLPTLTFEATRLLPLIAQFLEPFLARERLAAGTEPAVAAEYVARMLLSFVNAPGRWDLDDPGQVAELVRTEVLGGILHGGERDGPALAT